MAQVVFKAVEKQIEVIGGWSPHEGEFFLYLFRSDVENKLVWSNLVDFDPIDRISTNRLRFKLALFHIEAPAEFWNLVELRQGEAVRHGWDGTQWHDGLFKQSFPDDVPLAFTV